MSNRFLQQVRDAVVLLRPDHVRQEAEKPVRVLLHADSSSSYAEVEDFLAPATLSRDKRLEVANFLAREDDPAPSEGFDLLFYQAGFPVAKGWKPGQNAFPYHPSKLPNLVKDVLDARSEFSLPLARLFPPFRTVVVSETIHHVSRDNAFVSLMTALPNIMPSLAELPWAVGEFASDTAILTANQIRMAFVLAAASDREVGFREQRSEIGSIAAGAFGWRALAREFAGKIPFGGGLIPKAGIAYAGTYVVGLSLERIYRVGYGLTKPERREAYETAFSRGKEVAAALIEKVRG